MKKLPLIVFACLLLAIPALSQTEVYNIPRYSANQNYEANYCLKPEAQDLLNKALGLANENKFAEANVFLSRVIEIEPNVADLYFQRAQYSLALKNYEDVLKDVQNGAARKVNDDKRLMNISHILKLESRFTEGLELADIFISSDELKYLGYRLRASLSKNYADALEDTLKYVELAPLTKDIETPSLSFSLELLKNDPKLLNYYLRMLELLEKRSDFYANNVVSKTRLRNCVETIVPLNDVLTNNLYPHIVNAVRKSIIIYEMQGQNEKALELIKRSARYEPKSFSYVFRANLYAQRNYFNEAIADATALIDLNREDVRRQAGAYIFRGDFYVRAKEYGKALADYETAIRVDKSRATDLGSKIEETKLKMREEANRRK